MKDSIIKLYETLKNFLNINNPKLPNNSFYSLIIIIISIITIWTSINTIKSIYYFIKIISIVIICIYFISNYVPKNDEKFATFLALIPIIPANRVYTNTLDKETILIRLIPIIGNIHDIYQMFYNNKLIPKNGWNK